MTTGAPSDVLRRNLIFIGGKGGVGKSTLSGSVARALAASGKRVLKVAFEEPLRLPGELRKTGDRLWELNCDAQASFEEYVAMKLAGGALLKVFLQNKVIRYLTQAAPGIHELVMLGKVWHERSRYDHVVVDLPSTGHGLAMFHSARGFADLFKGGPIHRDALAMLETFGDARATGFLVVALPEEMPLVEALEYHGHLAAFFPRNPAAYLLNRRFPAPPGPEPKGDPSAWPSPFAADAADYAAKRAARERHNIRIWSREGLDYAELPFRAAETPAALAAELASDLARLGLVA